MSKHCIVHMNTGNVYDGAGTLELALLQYIGLPCGAKEQVAKNDYDETKDLSKKGCIYVHQEDHPQYRRKGHVKNYFINSAWHTPNWSSMWGKTGTVVDEAKKLGFTQLKNVVTQLEAIIIARGDEQKKRTDPGHQGILQKIEETMAELIRIDKKREKADVLIHLMRSKLVWNTLSDLFVACDLKNADLMHMSNPRHNDCIDIDTYTLSETWMMTNWKGNWNQVLRKGLYNSCKKGQSSSYYKKITDLALTALIELHSRWASEHSSLKTCLKNIIIYIEPLEKEAQRREEELKERLRLQAEERRVAGELKNEALRREAEGQAREAAERQAQARETAERQAREAAERQAQARETAERQARDAAGDNVQFHVTALNKAIYRVRCLEDTIYRQAAIFDMEFYQRESQYAVAYDGLLLQTGVVDLDHNLGVHMEARGRAHTYSNNLFLNPMFRQAAFDNYRHHYIAFDQVLYHLQLIREAGIVPDPPTRPPAGVSTAV